MDAGADEEYGHKLVKKFRLLLMEQRRFVEMTNRRRPAAGSATLTRMSTLHQQETLKRCISITSHDDLKWEGCRSR